MPKVCKVWVLAILLGISLTPTPARAQDRSAQAATEKRRAELQRRLEEIQKELAALDAEASASAPPSSPSAPIAPRPGPAPDAPAGKTTSEVVVTAARPNIVEAPLAQTTASVTAEQFRSDPAPSIGDFLVQVPGVTVVAGNGPRDTVISVRGSNARNTFGVRNVQVLEDGFPVTQPDGLARTDLVDPHAYGAIDVFQGPASTLYGNYATGGAINFRTRSGQDVGGIEAGLDLGSFGYRNLNVIGGSRTGSFEFMAFGSYAGGNGFTEHTSFHTTTANFLATYAVSPKDKLTFKFINNDVDTDTSVRLSLDQYNVNPYQKDCADLSGPACGSVSVFVNGFNGARVNLSATQALIGRHDRRTIAGMRWEHAFGERTTWRSQLVWDNRDIKQPGGSTGGGGTYPSFNFVSDVTSTAPIFGLNARHYAGIFANFENVNSYTYNIMPGGGEDPGPGGKAKLGGATQQVYATHGNAGARVREELDLSRTLTLVAGVGVEWTELDANQRSYAYPLNATPTVTTLAVNRKFFNVAPEIALNWTPRKEWQLHARLGTGYGTPQATNLFITPQGVPGNNTDLESQSNVGLDLGADFFLVPSLRASVTGFWEFFRNELVSQSPGASLQSFTYNAPRSEHRGLVAGLDWHVLGQAVPGPYLSASYMLDDQRYTEYVERLSAGTKSTAFDRSGNQLPGVNRSFLHLRAGWDQVDGIARGLGGFVDLDYRSSAFLDNGNLAKVPSSTLVHLNVHWERDFAGAFVKGVRVLFEVRNVADRIWVSSASNVSNSISPTTGEQNPASSVEASTGSILAGSPRSFFGGVRVKF